MNTRETAGVSFIWSSISLEPLATIWEAVRLAGMTVLFSVVFALSLNKKRSLRIIHAIGLSGVLIAIAGALQWVSGSDRILGLYTSPDVISLLGPGDSLGFTTPIINANSAAGLMTLSALVMLGLAIGREREKIHALPFTGFAISAAGVLATRSRGGLIALASGILIFSAVRYLGPRFRKKDSRFPRVVVIIGASHFVVTMALLLASYNVLVLEPFRSPLLMDPSGDLKVMLWGSSIPIIGDFMLTGIGHGAFSSVAAAYLGPVVNSTAWYAESLPLQVLIDLGVPFGILLMAASLALLLPLFWIGLRYSKWLGLTAGLLALGLQSLVDFGIEITGIAIPAVASLAVLAARIRASALRHRNHAPDPMMHPRILFLASICVIVFLVLGAALGVVTGSRSLHEGLMKSCLTTDMVNGADSPDGDCMTSAKRAVSIHPADHQLFKLGGAIALLSGDIDSARPWVERSITLCPGCLGPKLILAEVALEENVPDRAAGIYRALFNDRPDDVKRIFAKLATSKRPPEILARLFDKSPMRANEFARHLIDRHMIETGRRFLTALIRLEGKSPGRLLMLGRIYLLKGDIGQADRIATEILGLFPDSPDGYALQGMVETRTGNSLAALAMIDEALSRKPEHLQLALDKLLCLARLGRFEEFDRSSGTVRWRVNGRRGPSYQFHLASAIRLFKEDRTSGALHELDQARIFRPDTYVIPLWRGRIHYKSGDFQRSAQAYRRVLQLKPGNNEATARLDMLEIK